MKKWKITPHLILGILIFISVAFLWLQKGQWLYSDAGYTATSFQRLAQYLLPSSWNSSESYFSYDNTSLHSTRYLQDLFNALGQNIVYPLFLILSFFFSYKTLNLLYEKKSSFIGALLFTFNPLSVYLFNLPGFFFSYFSLPLVLYASEKFVSTRKNIYIILSILGYAFLISYTRMIGIYGLLLLIIGSLYIRYIISFVRTYSYNFLKYVGYHIIFFLPFILSIIYPYISGDNKYFQGIGNYASESMELYGESFYNGLLNTPFYEGLILKEPIKNFSGDFQNNLIYKLISLFFFCIILILTFLYKKKNDYLITILGLLILFTILIVMGPHFLPLGIFLNISYKYFPFISSNTFWLFLIYIPIISLFTAYLLNLSKHNTQTLRYRFITGLSYIFIFFSLGGIFLQNDKLKNIAIEDIPKPYFNTFYTKEIQKDSYISYPSPKEYPLIYNWSYYPFFIQNNSIYQPLLSDNKRLVNHKQGSLYQNIKKDYNHNLTILNLKNIFVFNDIRNPKEGEFEFYEIKDYIVESNRYYNQLIEDSSLYIKDDNESFTHFGINNDDSYEYFLYSPASILRQDMNSFFSGSIDITQKPIVIDPDSFHKPEIVDTYEVPDENKNISLQYKSAVLEPTKIYTKITDFDASKPFLLQLNQTFGMSWKVKWITKEEFEEKPCIDEYRQYPITQNAVCQYEATILDLRDTKYLDNPSVSEERHFEGNFVGNAWLVTPEDIPEDMRGQSELYAVIIYEKQIYYAWALVISGLTFLVLVVLSIREAIISYRRKKHE